MAGRAKAEFKALIDCTIFEIDVHLDHDPNFDGWRRSSGAWFFLFLFLATGGVNIRIREVNK